MIEGGGLGVFRPDEVGPMSVQVPNGVVDVAVRRREEAVDVARRYLSYFQGHGATGRRPTRRCSGRSCPPDRRRAYDVHRRSTCWPTTGRSSSCGRRSRPGW